MWVNQYSGLQFFTWRMQIKSKIFFRRDKNAPWLAVCTGHFSCLGFTENLDSVSLVFVKCEFFSIVSSNMLSTFTPLHWVQLNTLFFFPSVSLFFTFEKKFPGYVVFWPLYSFNPLNSPNSQYCFCSLTRPVASVWSVLSWTESTLLLLCTALKSTNLTLQKVMLFIFYSKIIIL